MATRWAQLPEWPPEWPDIACPVDPKPPRAVDDVEEEDEVDDDELVLLPLLPEKNPTEVEFDGRLELVEP